MKSKIFVALAILSMFFQCVPANVFAATSATPTVTTSVVIKDGNNDKILEEYELDTATTKKSVDENGNIVYTTTTTASDASINNNSRATQNNSKTFYGWKGKVSINYYDNGSQAKLNSASASWTHVSGSTAISKSKRFIYGQDMMVNSRNGSKTFTGTSVSASPNWPKGKYAYNVGNKVGANVSAKIKGKYVYVFCDVKF